MEIVETKTCAKCNEVKPVTDFEQNGEYLRRSCRPCRKPIRDARSKKWLENNPELAREYTRIRNLALMDFIKENPDSPEARNYYSKQKKSSDKITKWMQENPDDPEVIEMRSRNRATSRAFYIRNPEYQHEQYIARIDKDPSYIKRQWDRRKELHGSGHPRDRYARFIKPRRESDPEFKLLLNMRSRITSVLRKASQGKLCKTMSLLGCSMETFMEYIADQFKLGMNWNNYGEGGWVIDHIQPCASFDKTDPTWQKKCFNWLNLQPLWEQENLIKSDKFPQLACGLGGTTPYST